MAERERTPVGWNAWLNWVMSSSIGLTIGLVVYLPLALILGDELELAARTLVSGAAGAAFGASIGRSTSRQPTRWPGEGAS